VSEIPVKLYRSADRLTVAAPMPGLLPEDFAIEITADNRLVLRGGLRGIPADVQVFHRLERGDGPDHQPQLVEEQREMLLDEWTVGDYRREIKLPNAVDGRLTTATYGNGVLVVALALAEQVVAAQISLQRTGPGRGEYVGGAGHPVQPWTTADHVQAVHQFYAR
jgi:HSP20 family protein